MAILYKNNAVSALASSINNVATSMSVTAGQGALFPTISGSDYFYVTIISFSNPSSYEIVKVTARSTDTFTIVRAQDGTTAAAWSANDRVELRITNALLSDALGERALVGGSNATGTWPISVSGNAATVSSITSGQVTTALGYTPYNATNPNGYITSASLSSYLPLTGGTLTGDLRINSDWGAGSFNEQLIIYGTYPSMTFRSTQSDTGWLIHTQGDGGLTYYSIAGALTNDWTQRMTLLTNGELRRGGASGDLYLHSGNYGSYALPLSGGQITGQVEFRSANQLTFSDGANAMRGFIKSLANTGTGAAGLVIATSGGESIVFKDGNADSGDINFVIRGDGALLQGGSNQLLHAGNYSSYLNNSFVRAIGAASSSNDWNSLGNSYPNTVEQVDPNNFSSTSNGPTAASYTYGTLLNFSTQSNSQAQIYISHAGNDLIFRGGWNGNSWQTWNKVLTNQNYSSYSLPLSGGTLSGTLYFTDTTNGISKAGGRLTIRSESTDDVANFAGYGLYLPRSGQTAGLYVQSPIEARGGLRMGDAAGNGTITVGADTAATANRLVQRDSGGDVYGRYFFGVHFNQSSSNTENPSIAAFWTNSGSDNYNRKSSPAHVISQLGLITTGNYSSYALPLSGGTLSGRLFASFGGRTNYYTGSNIEVQTGDNTPPSISFHRAGYSATSLYESDGELYVNAWTSRAQNGKLLSSGNYSSYALPLSGGTISGAIRASQITAGGSTNTDANLGVQGTTHLTGTIYYGGTVGNVNSWSSLSTSSSGTHTFSGSRFVFDRYGYGSQPLLTLESGAITLSQAAYAGSGITVNSGSAAGIGINLYSGSPSSPTYGLFFAQTANFGTYGAVSADWATYFTMNATANRGWVFREIESLGNVAAISNQGNMTLRSHFEQGNNIARPNVNWSASGNSTGMVIFYLPGTTSNYGMVHMVFDIYEYNGNSVSTVIVGGHNWSTNWYNIGANVIGSCGKEVRLGVKDGRFCVVFGTSGSVWEYGTIVLRKIHNGSFYDNVMDMVGNWSATQTTTESFTSITGDLRALRTPASFNAGGAITQAGNQVLHAGNFTNYAPGNGSTWTFGDVYSNNWLRNNNSGTGLYNQATANHWYSDGQYWNVGYAGTTGIRLRNGHAGTVMGYLYGETNGRFGLLNAQGSWAVSLNPDNHKHVLFGGGYGDNAYNTRDGVRLLLGGGDGDAQGNYYIGTNFNNYGGNYTKLDLAWHTGIRIGAQASYGGVRFFDSEDFGSVVFSVNTGDSNVRTTNTHYAYAFRGNGNVAGTGEATYHPAGIYSVSTNWLYGTIYMNGNIISGCGNIYLDTNHGNSVVGLYSSYRYQGVFAMGDSYKMSADGTSLANMYGIAWSHPNAGGAAGNLTDHGMLIINNGSFRCAISNSIVASGNITAYSDERLKRNWRDMPENFVERLAQVKVGRYERIDDGVEQVGVSAQSLQPLLPEAIQIAKDEIGTLSVSYGNAAMASAVELAKEIVKLRAELDALKAKLN